MASPVISNRRYQVSKWTYLFVIFSLTSSAGGVFADDTPKSSVWTEDERPIGVTRDGTELQQLDEMESKGILPRQLEDKDSGESDD